ncbi:MAG: hypothetical protein LBP94_04420, partial [Zoogloeaceae bacterium]|nr:hypothetical protein [Zoogloeaceae bacterium]
MPEFYPALITDTVASHACGIRMSPVTYKCHIFVFGSILAIMLRIAFSCWIIALALGVVPKAFAFGFVAPEEMEAGVAKCSGKNSVNSFECARGIEQKALSTEGKVVSRSGDALQIHTEKKIISLVDVIVDSWSNYISYSYLGYNQTINSHILHVQYYEGFAYMVIHHQSGEQASPSG